MAEMTWQELWDQAKERRISRRRERLQRSGERENLRRRLAERPGVEDGGAAVAFSRRTFHSQERRHQERLYMRGLVELELAGEAGTLQAHAQNISYGGIGLYLRKPLEVGRKVWVRIRYLKARGQEDDEGIRGQVRWCRPQGNWFAAGIAFDRMDPDLNPGLVSFLEQTEWLRGRSAARG